MRILGIDPGIERTGFAVLEKKDGKIYLLDFGCIQTEKKNSFSHRLRSLAEDLGSLIRQWKPEGAVLEELFFSKNIKTAIKVSHARGVIMEVLEEHGISIAELNPGQVKLGLTGDGKADKLQMKKMIHYLLGITLKSDDAADAIACGLAGLNQFGSLTIPSA